MWIGVISDTHGLLRPEAAQSLAGCDHILHAGDIGDDAILEALRNIAPVTAIRGNIDHGGVCGDLPPTDIVELDGRLFYLVHAREELDINPQAAGISAVIFGHSHRPEISCSNGVLYFNPGSAGPRRFSLPITLGILKCTSNALTPSIVPLVTAT